MATESIQFDSDKIGLGPLMISDEVSDPVMNEQAPNVFKKSAEKLNVVDVYSIASSVGQEFQRLIDAFGGDVFSEVMPKIIGILEILEVIVSKQENKKDEIMELNASLQKLLMESRLKDQKQQEEIEIVESAWKDETRNLLETVATLESDNRKLTAILTEQLEKEEVVENDVRVVPEQQSTIISKLREQLDKQRDETRGKNKILEEQTQEIEALQSQVIRLTQLNVDIRNKVYLLEQQGKSLVQQRTELEAKLNQKATAVTDIQLRSLNKKDLMNSEESMTKPRATSINSTDDNWPGDPLSTNKLVIDLTDPNRPRYTLEELREVLNDRNQLKARCFLLEEELIFYKGIARKCGMDERWEELNEGEIHESRRQVIEQQNHKPPESGIRRFFSYLTGTTTLHGGSKPTPKYHQVVETTAVKDLINTGDMRELLPVTNADADLPDHTTSSETISCTSAAEEIADLSP